MSMQVDNFELQASHGPTRDLLKWQLATLSYLSNKDP